jgi:hypothetical protein
VGCPSGVTVLIVSGIVEPIPGYMWGCGGVEGNPHLKHACPATLIAGAAFVALRAPGRAESEANATHTTPTTPVLAPAQTP